MHEINRRQFMKAAAGTVAALALPPLAGDGRSAPLPSEGASGRRSLLLILVDQWRADCLGFLGHPVVRTPNLDRLAAQGVSFSRAYCPVHACAPSRASLFTGVHAAVHGVEGNHATLRPEKRRVFVEELAEAGYDTALVGKLHLAPRSRAFGFRFFQRHDAACSNYTEEEPRDSAYVDFLEASGFAGGRARAVRLFTEDEGCLESNYRRFLLGSGFLEERQHESVWVADTAIRYLKESREKSKPFFLNVSFFSPHQPYLCPAPWGMDLYPPDKLPWPGGWRSDPVDKPIAAASVAVKRARRWNPVWGERGVREILSAYYACMSLVDREIGRVLDALRALGLDETTDIVFTADHGDYAGQFGAFTKGTGHEASARVPLIVSRARGAPNAPRVIEEPVSLLDLAPTILGWAGAKPLEGAVGDDLGPVIEGRSLPSRTVFWRTRGQSMAVGGGLKLMRQEKAGGVDWEAYDLNKDPWESRNLAAGGLPATHAGLCRQLDEWLREGASGGARPLAVS